MRGKEMGGGLRRLDNTGGWGGRDRTSEWRNQNPLPYRLATPQQRRPERGESGRAIRLRDLRPLEGLAPFQQAESVKFPQNPGNRATHYNRPDVFHGPTRFPPPPGRPDG